LLRPLVESHYEVQTGLAVGDAPRAADIVLLRRTSTATPPFQGLWRWLTPWNVLEFKGPTVSARVADLDALVELGLGVHRRLNEEQEKRDLPQLGREEVSFWYLANHLGGRFLRDAATLLGALEPLADGVWRAHSLARSVLLVSGSTVAVERDSMPLHVLAKEPEETRLAVARLVVENAELWQVRSTCLGTFLPDVWKEIVRMARAKKEQAAFDLRPLLEVLGPDEFIKEVGLKAAIEELGIKRVVDEIGVKRVVDEIGAKQVVEELGMDELLAGLSPKQRKELKRRLEQS
jgi:hypothetical protein